MKKSELRKLVREAIIRESSHKLTSDQAAIVKNLQHELRGHRDEDDVKTKDLEEFAVVFTDYNPHIPVKEIGLEDFWEWFDH